jgi:hypothetical protein
MFYTEIWLLRDQRAFCFTEVSPDFSVGVFWFWGIFHSISTFWQVFTRSGFALGYWLVTKGITRSGSALGYCLVTKGLTRSGSALGYCLVTKGLTRSGSALGYCLVTKGLTRSGSVLGYCLVWSLLLVMPSTSGLTLHFIIFPLWSLLHSGTGQLEMWDQRTSDIGINVGPSCPTEGPCLFRTYWMA